MEIQKSSCFEVTRSFDGKHKYDAFGLFNNTRVCAKDFMSNFFTFANLCIHVPDSLECEWLLYSISELGQRDFCSQPLSTEDVEKWLLEIIHHTRASLKMAAQQCLNWDGDDYDFKKVLEQIAQEKTDETTTVGLLCRVKVEDPDVEKFLDAEEELYDDRKKWLKGKPVVELAKFDYILLNLILFTTSLCTPDFETIKSEVELSIKQLLTQI